MLDAYDVSEIISSMWKHRPFSVIDLPILVKTQDGLKTISQIKQDPEFGIVIELDN